MRYDKVYWNDVKRAVDCVPRVSELMGKSILITGATGMICSSVIDLLIWLNREKEAGIRLILAGRSAKRITERFSGILARDGFEYVYYDATSQEIPDIRSDYVIHGASNANPAVYVREPVETLLGNVLGLRNILEGVRKHKGCRVLYLSSSEVYGNRTDGSTAGYHEEDYGYLDILNSRACYPSGKRAAETLCACYDQEYDVDTVIARPGHVYGPSITKTDSRASAAFTREAASGTDIVMKSAGRQKRSYCYTLDCASAILTILINGQKGEAYNIANRNSEVTIRQMAEALSRAGGVRVIFENPTDAEAKGYNLMNQSVLCPEKLEGLGWHAEFGLSEGAEKTILYYGESEDH